ncbi:TPR domain protein [Aspergillus piperis CBS 112811]|uniref:TPR domain protein n=1 Tax=Aspergillus piperis CBS 112811 TaxID=1448313 RepID=A0A8G1QSE0_9EURO|nr:TPR domain protein [Aspergillus piperis CBS 112811]RAH52066.1 TPR domain protein [Aspergillus piperis CBS 112811]
MLGAASRRAVAIPRTLAHRHHQHAFSSSSFSTRTIPSILRSRPTGAAPTSLLRTVQATTIQTRPLSFAQKMKRGYQEASRGIWRNNPILLPLALLSVATATAIFSYIAYKEATEVGPQYHKFPPPVAERLRTAIYYTDVKLNPVKAIDAYSEAIKLAAELQMHPYSDEVMGIRLQVTKCLEMAGLVPAAIQVLEKTRADAYHWVKTNMETEAFKRGESDYYFARGPSAEKGELAAEPMKVDPAIAESYEKMKQAEIYEYEQVEKTLAKVVGMSVKLAELYKSDHIQDDKKAEEALEFAVQLSLGEVQRRHQAKVPIGGGNWLTLTEIGTALSELGQHYASKGKLDLSLPLYLRAFDLINANEGGVPSCKQVTLMYNISGCIGYPALDGVAPSSDPGVSRAEAIEAARKWAQGAIERAEKVEPSEDSVECDYSCASAKVMLGQLAVFHNKPEEALKYYYEAKDLYNRLELSSDAEDVSRLIKDLEKKKK